MPSGRMRRRSAISTRASWTSIASRCWARHRSRPRSPRSCRSAPRATCSPTWDGSQRLGVPHPLLMYVTQDARDSRAYIASVFQSGLTMPDRDYYLAMDARNVELRRALDAYVARLLALAGENAAEAAARRVTALEGRIANHHWTKAQNRDPVKTYNKVTLAAAPTDDARVRLVRVPRRRGRPGRSRRSTSTSPPTCANWRRSSRAPRSPTGASTSSSACSTPTRRTSRRISSRPTSSSASARCAARPTQQPRWRRGVQLLDGSIGELLGRLYVGTQLQRRSHGPACSRWSTT